MLGNVVGMQYNVLRSPPGLVVLARPALNLAALGWSIFGVALLLSAVDVVRWRPNLIASSLVLAEFVLLIVARLPSLEDWQETLEGLSIFKAYDPLAAATLEGNAFEFNVAVLGGIGLAAVVAAFLAFRVRDLPANA